MTYIVIGVLAVACILVVLLSMCRAASHRDDRDFRPKPELFDLPVPRSALCTCFIRNGLEYTERGCPLHGERSWRG